MQKLRNQRVTLSTAQCHCASTHTDSTEKLLDRIQIQYVTVSSDEQEKYKGQYVMSLLIQRTSSYADLLRKM